MNFKTKLSKLVANINSGYKHQLIEIKHTFNKDLEKVLKILVKEGVILSYSVNCKMNYFTIYLRRTKGLNSPTKLFLHSKVSWPKFVTEYNLASKVYKDSKKLVITSTNNGLIVNSNQQRRGGELLLEII